ncbi:MAG: tRNA (guanosine(37)-N1)-methyltransferase TrmD [Thiomargarita sp.]|nr:tRNA (guanosine(37)-N1)-methyltransferase TrmD [Thiomargarita sp.]
MHIGIITLFPEMFTALHQGGVTRRALKKDLLELSLWNPRDFTLDKHCSVDDRPYGGGPGMLMQVQPLRSAIQTAMQTMDVNTRVIYLSPQGRKLDQTGVEKLVSYQNFLLVAGHYEGVDERILEHDIDEEWSIGDYVLSGGELAAMVIIDAVSRYLPNALGHEQSAKEDSFYTGLLDYPHYTRPEEIEEQKVPAVLLSGNHAAIARWRQKQALGRTWERRQDLLKKYPLNPIQKTLLTEFIEEQKGGNE